MRCVSAPDTRGEFVGGHLGERTEIAHPRRRRGDGGDGGDGTARNALADRRHESRFKLRWTDTLPPAAVRDDVICRRAAAGYAGGTLPRGVPARATVVRAGGLYFVVGPVDRRAGEFLVVGVLDASFRWLTGLTTQQPSRLCSLCPGGGVRTQHSGS
jgi:hypothetical protein